MNPPSGDPTRPGQTGSTGESGPQGLLEQVRLTIAAARRLLQGHVDLAKAELSVITSEIVATVAKAAAAAALLLFVGMLVPIGLILFLGEAIFGSLGWGVLLGTELFVGLALSLLLSALGLGGGALRGLLAGIVLGIAVALLFGSGVANQGWAQLGDQLLPNVQADYRTLAMAAGGGALALGVLLALVGLAKGGLGGLIGGLVGGAILGGLIGALSAVTVSGQVAAGIGVAIALGVWPLIALLSLRSFDPARLKERFYPAATIDTTRETIEWLKRIRG